MQIPLVSLDSLLPATNAAAPPATEGGGFARSLRERQDALATPAADSAAQSPEPAKTTVPRRDGESRQGAQDNGAELEERGAPLAKEAAQSSSGRGSKAGSSDIPLVSATDPAKIQAKKALSPDAPVLKDIGAAVPEFPPLACEDPSPALSHTSLTDVEMFPEAAAQGASVLPVPDTSLPGTERSASRPTSPGEEAGDSGAVPETDASASPENSRVSTVSQGEVVAASVLKSDSLPTSRLNQTSTVAGEIPEEPAFEGKVATGSVSGREGHGAVSSLSAASTQEAVDPAATGSAEISGTRGAKTDSPNLAAEPLSSETSGDRPVSGSGSAARAEEAVATVPRGPSLAVNASLDSTPETPAARADAPAVAPAIGGAPSSAQGVSPSPVASDLTAATEPAPARVSPATARQDIPASASFRLPVDSAVIDSLRVSPAQSQPTSVLAQAATGIATLAEGGAALRETVVPPRLREDLRGSRLDTSSDRRFAQLLGETRGAVRVSVAQGESLPVMDSGKGEGAELLFREPGAQVEPGIFRAAADNGSNPTVFSAVGQGGATPQAASSGSGTPAAATPFTLPVPEEQVYQQVASRLILVNGERHSRMTMRLYPEELGQVKLELTVEGDRVRVQMHAQNQQVQEVLEKYLPRLRESFEQQGLKLEEAQVTYDSPGQGGRGSFQESRQSFFASRSAGRSAGRTAGEEEAVVTPPPTPANSRPGGISLRV